MFDQYVTCVNGAWYFHPVLVFALCMVASWMPSFFRGCYYLLRPILSALAAVIRKFTIF